MRISQPMPDRRRSLLRGADRTETVWRSSVNFGCTPASRKPQQFSPSRHPAWIFTATALGALWRGRRLHLLLSCSQEAIVWFERERAANPGSKLAHAWLAAAYGLEDDLARAAAEFSEARKLSGGMNYSSIIRIR